MDIALILVLAIVVLFFWAFYASQLKNVDILAHSALKEINALHRLLRRLERRLEDVELLAVSTSKRLNESSEGGNDNVQ